MHAGATGVRVTAERRPTPARGGICSPLLFRVPSGKMGTAPPEDNTPSAPREKTRETAAECVNRTDPPHRLPGELGPSGGERHRLLGADAGRVEEDRVGSPDEGARLALRVPPVPLADQRDDRLPVRARPGRPKLQVAPLGAGLRARPDA